MEPVKLSYNLDLTDKSSWLTVTAAPQVRASFAYVQELGDFYCGPAFFTAREDLPSYLIKLCLGGGGVLEYGRESCAVGTGDVFWIDCRKHQHYCTDPSEGAWHILWVHLYGPTTEAYYNAFLEQNLGSNLIRGGVHSPLLGVFDELFSIYRDGRNSLQDDIQASSLLTRLMTECIRLTKASRSARPMPEYIAAAKAYISENYQEELTLDALARRLSINKYSLQKLFKRHLGMSPNEYLTRTRLDMAKRMLRTTEDSIIQIAQGVGYTATYFDSVFKKYEGVTPRGYRMRWYDSSPEAR